MEVQVKLSRLVQGGLIILIVAFGFLRASPAVSNEILDTELCSSTWHEYVELVRRVSDELSNEEVEFLFVERRGYVHDCLGVQPRAEVVEWIESFHKGLPFDKVGPLPAESTFWPSNVCNTGRPQEAPQSGYVLVLLPVDISVLDLEICETRVRNSLNRLVSHGIQE